MPTPRTSVLGVLVLWVFLAGLGGTAAAVDADRVRAFSSAQANVFVLEHYAEMKIPPFEFKCEKPHKLHPTLRWVGGVATDFTEEDSAEDRAKHCNDQIGNFIATCKKHMDHDHALDSASPYFDPDCVTKSQRKQCIAHFVRQRVQCGALAQAKRKADKEATAEVRRKQVAAAGDPAQIDEAERERIRKDEEEAEQELADQQRKVHAARLQDIQERTRELDDQLADWNAALQKREQEFDQQERGHQRALARQEQEAKRWDRQFRSGLAKRDMDAKAWQSKQRRTMAPVVKERSRMKVDKHDPSLLGTFDGDADRTDEARRNTLQILDHHRSQCRANWAQWKDIGGHAAFCEKVERMREMVASGASPEEIEANLGKTTR